MESESWSDGESSPAAAGRTDEEEEEELLPLYCRDRRSLRTVGVLDRLLSQRSEKSEFGLNLSLAFKGAACIVLANLPTLLWPLREDIPKHRKPLTGMISLYIAFTLWKTLGETIAFALQGLIGTLLASANVLLVLVTVGATPSTSSGQALVWAAFVLPTLLFLFLNFDNNTRQLGLSTHVLLMMVVMSPDGLDLDDVTEHLYVVAVGTALAVLTALVPPPPIMPRHDPGRGVRAALRYAEEELDEITESIAELFMDVVQAFKASNESMEAEGFIAQANQLHATLDGLGTIIDAAWFEGGCFHTGALRRRFSLCGRRAHLSALQETRGVLSEALDSLSMLAHVVHYRGAACKDSITTDQVDSLLWDAAEFIHDQLAIVPEVLFRAKAGQDVSSLVSKAAARKDRLIEDFGKAFASGEANETGLVRGSKSLSWGSLCDWEKVPISNGLAEATFVYHMRRIAERLVRKLQEQTLPCKSGLLARLYSLVDPAQLFSLKHLLFVVRQSITICVCFVLCTRFYDYTPTMVTTICLLVTEGYKGAMLKKNIGRLQGVVLGTVFPHLFYDWFNTCSETSAVALAFVLFFYEWMALFVYFSSKDAGYIAVLVAGFGANAMCQGCGRQGLRSSSLYDTIEQNAMGIAILTAVDLVFASRRASDVGNKVMYNAVGTKDMEGAGILPLLKQGLATAVPVCSTDPVEARKLRTPRVLDFGRWNAEMMRLCQLALFVSDEASSEPRYMRRAWPSKMYEAVVKGAGDLRLQVAALNDVVEDGGADFVLELQDVPELFHFVRRVQKNVACISDMVYLALKHFDGEKGGSKCRTEEIYAISRSLFVPQPEEVMELMRAISAREDHTGVTPRDIDKYRYCRSSVVVFSLLSIVRCVHSLRGSVVKSIERR
eukprot:TRINITY_DN15199_c0_g1_i2.p1 TRINITY_DN15199_c0_g1~~TRINITY_DN15199_c0_g1_i2.p1  ORF type:complete len:893 (-),score=191.68 TRINITY_DN15199_c0_g1_i2:85-2763(-)